MRPIIRAVVTCVLALAACGRPADVAPASGLPTATSASTSAASAPATTPTASVIEPWVVMTGHAGNGIGIYLARPHDFDRRWIFSDIPSSTVHRPDWSPDGRQIAVEVLGDGDLPPGSIWIGEADGSGAHQVAACDARPCLQLAMPAWAPDGTSLAMVRYDIAPDGKAAGKTAIEILDLATGRRRTIAQTTDGRTSVAYPRWAPDGRSIVLELQTYSSVTQDTITGSAIAIVATDGSGPHEPRAITKFDAFGAHPDWSPDGQRIVFSSYGIESFETGAPRASNLYIVRPDGSELKQVTHFSLGGSRAGHASWTPDGKQIIFSKVDGTDFDGFGARHVTFIDADGSNLRQMEGFLGTYARLQPTR